MLEAKIRDIQIQPLKGAGSLKLKVARMTMAGLETLSGRVKDHSFVGVTSEKKSKRYHNFLTQRTQVDPEKHLYVPGDPRLALIKPGMDVHGLYFSYRERFTVHDPGIDRRLSVIPLQIF